MNLLAPKLRIPVLSLLALVFLSLNGIAYGQQSQRIIATVNDDLISAFDLNARISLMITFLGLDNSEATRNRLRRQALNDLIDAKLKLQEAKAFNIKVSDAEIDRSIKNLEKRNKMKKGSMEDVLAATGTPISALEDRFRADIAWAKFLNRRFRPSIQISDKELDSSIAEIERNKGKPEVLASEIFLGFTSPDKNQAVKELSDELYQELSKGANFVAVAKNFSQSPTAAVGGDLGWTLVSQLPPTLRKIVQNMESGQISPPQRTAKGYYIVQLRGKRKAAGLDKPEEKPDTFELFQIVIPLNDPPTEKDKNDKLKQAMQITENAKQCEDMKGYAAQTGSDLSGNLGMVKTSSLSPDLRNLVKGLAVKQPSQPIILGSSVIVVMICSKKVAKVSKLSQTDKREEQRLKLIAERMNLAARQHLRSLRRAAFIDIRQ